MFKMLASRMAVFVDTLPIIGICLLGIFGVTAFIILVVHGLNKFSAWIENRKNKGSAE